MAQAVPWNVRGIDPDVREAALQAARRAGMTLGEWLNSVIGETVAGHDADHLEEEQTSLPLPAAEDPLEAVARRIARLNERGSSAALAATGAIPQSKDLERVAKIIETAVDTLDRGAREREAKTAAALDAMADMLEHRSAKEAKAVTARLVEPALAPPVKPPVAPARRWNDTPETSVETLRAGNPVREMIERIESRLDAMTEQAQTPKVEASLKELDQRLQDIARKIDDPVKRSQPVAPAPDENIRRIEGKLSAILDSLNQQTLNTVRSAAAQPTPVVEAPVAMPAPGPAARLLEERRSQPARNVRSAIDDITSRQRDLDDGSAAASAPRAAYQAPAYQPPAYSVEPQIGDLKQQLQRLSDKIGNGASNGATQQIDQLRKEIAGVSHAIEDLAPRHVVVSLEGAIRDLAQRIEHTREGGLKAQQLAPVEKLLVDLRIAVESLRESGAIDVLRGDLKALSDRITASTARNGGDREALQALQTQMTDLRQLVQRAQEPVALEGLEHRIAGLGDKLERIAMRPQDTGASAGLASAVADVRSTLQNALPTDLLARIEKRIGDLGRIEAHLGEIAAHMQDVPGRADIDALHARMERMHSTLLERPMTVAEGNIGSHDLSAIQSLLLTLSDKIDTAQKSNDQLSLAALQMQLAGIGEKLDAGRGLSSDALDRSLRDVSSKLDGLRQTAIEAAETGARNALRDSAGSQHDLSSIQSMLLTLSDKIDTAQSNNDEHSLAALQMQIARIAERLDTSSSPASSTLDRSLKDLMSQLDSLRHSTIEAAEVAARNAVRGSSTPDTGFDAISRELAGLREAQNEADHRTQVTLTAVNDALIKVVSRLGQLENDTAAPRMAPVAAPMAKEPAAKEAAYRAASKAAAAAPARIAAEIPIEPGTGRPGTNGARPVASIDANAAPDGKAAFIAAARRAAKAAEEQAAGALRAHRDAAEAPEGGGRLGGLRQTLTARKKPIMIGIAAALVGLVTLQAFHAMRSEGPRPQDPPRTSPPPVDPSQAKPEKQSQAPERQKVATLPLPTTSHPNDVDHVGSLGPQPGQPSQPDLAQPMPPTIKQVAELTPLAAPITSDKLRAGLQAADPLALHEIGIRFIEGRGVPRDAAIGAKFLEASAQLGLAPAQYRVGSLYREGRGVAADKVKALEWFRSAANNGNARAMHNVGVLLAEGVGGAPDYAAAAEWFNRASDLNVRDSQYNLAILYARGLGVTQDLGASYKWFSAAATQGDEDAKKKRDDVAGRMSPEQLAAAKTATAAWKPLPLNPAANDVTEPAGGWDNPAKSPEVKAPEAPKGLDKVSEKRKPKSA